MANSCCLWSGLCFRQLFLEWESYIWTFTSNAFGGNTRLMQMLESLKLIVERLLLNIVDKISGQELEFVGQLQEKMHLAYVYTLLFDAIIHMERGNQIISYLMQVLKVSLHLLMQSAIWGVGTKLEASLCLEVKDKGLLEERDFLF